MRLSVWLWASVTGSLCSSLMITPIVGLRATDMALVAAGVKDIIPAMLLLMILSIDLSPLPMFIPSWNHQEYTGQMVSILTRCPLYHGNEAKL